MSTAFHPQTDGATERANRSIAQILCTVVSNNQKDWSDKCPMVEFTINSSINATTGYTPFELNYRYMPQSGQHISTDTTFKGVKQFAQQAVWNLLDAHDEGQEWLVKEILAHKWTNNNLELQVKWMLGDDTWELLSSCKDLEALDVYLELQGAKEPQDLSQREQANK